MANSLWLKNTLSIDLILSVLTDPFTVEFGTFDILYNRAVKIFVRNEFLNVICSNNTFIVLKGITKMECIAHI